MNRHPGLSWPTFWAVTPGFCEAIAGRVNYGPAFFMGNVKKEINDYLSKQILITDPAKDA
jgi:hypothetical protein